MGDGADAVHQPMAADPAVPRLGLCQPRIVDEVAQAGQLRRQPELAADRAAAVRRRGDRSAADLGRAGDPARLSGRLLDLLGTRLLAFRHDLRDHRADLESSLVRRLSLALHARARPDRAAARRSLVPAHVRPAVRRDARAVAAHRRQAPSTRPPARRRAPCALLPRARASSCRAPFPLPRHGSPASIAAWSAR